MFSYKSVIATSVILQGDLVANYIVITLKYYDYAIIIKHAKFSYSSIESQLLPCAPACGCKLYALAV